MSLFQDLVLHLDNAFRSWESGLSSLSSGNPGQYCSEFHRLLFQFEHVASGVVPIFTYLNRFYVESKLHTDLRLEMTKLFNLIVVSPHVHKIVGESFGKRGWDDPLLIT